MPDTIRDERRPAASDLKPPAVAREVVLVGGGSRARAWLDPLRRSARLRVVATVARSGDSVAPELPCCTSLAEAISRYPDAAFAVALPPRAALQAALSLASADRHAVVEAPLHASLVDEILPSTAEAVRVAHGWVTLPGLRAAQAVWRQGGSGRMRVEIAGLPEEEGGDPHERLVHALALVRALLPQAEPVALHAGAAAAFDLEFAMQSATGTWQLQLHLLPQGQHLAVHIDRDGAAPLSWSWARDRERVAIKSVSSPVLRTTPPATVRALAQLLPDAIRGDSLVEAAAVLGLTRRCLALLPTSLPLGARVLRQSASIAQRRPADVLGRIGLSGELPPRPHRVPTIALTLPPEPFELWSFRAGVKPVAFLTVRPDDVDRTLAYFGAVAHERRERRVQVATQDRWIDRRDLGEPRVELYIAHDAALARRAAYLQAEVDPSRALHEIGALVGYPPCCVDAFAQQEDRANNTANRYQSLARTLRPDGSVPHPWPWQLNNLHTMIVPFYPCSYRCESALAWACASLDEMGRVYPEAVSALCAALAQPVLYFDHEHQIALDGRYREGVVSYRNASCPPWVSAPFGTLATVIASGDRLLLDERRLLVERESEVALQLQRTDPTLGFVAPFGVTAADVPR